MMPDFPPDPPTDEYEGEVIDGGWRPAPTTTARILVYPGSGTMWVRAKSGGYVVTDAKLLRAELKEHQPDVELWRVTDGGKRVPVGVPALIEQHGRRVDRLVYDLTAQRSVYNPTSDRGGELIMACAPLDPDTTAEWSPECDRYLKLLLGEQRERAQDWLATVTDLRFPTAALYLEGTRGCGKGMLCAAVARLWGRAFTAYRDVIGDYNSALRECPIVVVDEVAPITPEGSGVFRSLISETTRALTEKYRPAGSLNGAVRLIIAANNADALRIRENLTSADEEAIGERILHVQCDPEAGAYLEALGGRQHTADWVTVQSTGKPGTLTRHIQWLIENRKVQRGNRFLVAGQAEEWLRGAGMRGGVLQDVLTVAALCMVARGGDPNKYACFNQGDTILVSPQQLYERWSEVMPRGKCYSLPQIGRALSVVSIGQTRHRPPGAPRKHRGPRCHIIPRARIEALADSCGIDLTSGPLAEAEEA